MDIEKRKSDYSAFWIVKIMFCYFDVIHSIHIMKKKKNDE